MLILLVWVCTWNSLALWSQIFNCCFRGFSSLIKKKTAGKQKKMAINWKRKNEYYSISTELFLLEAHDGLYQTEYSYEWWWIKTSCAKGRLKSESCLLKGWEKEEGGERWKDKQRRLFFLLSIYFAVSWWRRSRRRQKTQFFFSRTIRMHLLLLPLQPGRWDGVWKTFCFGRGL